jgi:putative transposase
VLGADRHERTDQRLRHPNGNLPCLLTTQPGDIPLSISWPQASPKEQLRSESFCPTVVEPRRRIDQALNAVIMEAWVKGVSTRKVEALVAAIGSEAGTPARRSATSARDSTPRSRRVPGATPRRLP